MIWSFLRTNHIYLLFLKRLNQVKFDTMSDVMTLLEYLDKSKGVSIDTRTIREGQIYFSIRGENFDGNAYAQDALNKGAILSVVDNRELQGTPNMFFVENVLESLQDLSSLFRKRFSIPVVAITGTNGKTTTKELLHAVLKEKFIVHSTKGNFNNHIGVPLTLLGLKKQHDIAIIEMGASSENEIAFLCKIAQPTAGLITNIGKAHIEGFGSVETIARTKSELYDFLLSTEGLIFLSDKLCENSYFNAGKYKNVASYSGESLKGSRLISVELKANEPCVKLELNKIDGSIIEISSKLFGEYNFDNLVNIIKIADYYGVNGAQIKTGIESYMPSNNRSQLIRDQNNNQIIMDAYNANPSSIEAALKHFVKLDSPVSKIVLLGDMLEMGEESLTEHKKVIEYLGALEELISVFVGQEFNNAKRVLELDNKTISGHFFRSSAECKSWWKQKAFNNSMILVKGSRGIALEKIFEED